MPWSESIFIHWARHLTDPSNHGKLCILVLWYLSFSNGLLFIYSWNFWLNSLSVFSPVFSILLFFALLLQLFLQTTFILAIVLLMFKIFCSVRFFKNSILLQFHTHSIFFSFTWVYLPFFPHPASFLFPPNCFFYLFHYLSC